jgi:outer membrane receptor for ferric coprogen and ferric-rhodotorulic acid
MKISSLSLISGLILPFQITAALDSTTTNTATTTTRDPKLLETLLVESEDSAESKSYVPKKTTIASKLPLSPNQIPQSVSVVSQQRIIDQNLSSIEDALATVPGVTVITNSTAHSQYRSRGYNLNTSTDGIPSFNGISGVEQYDLAIYQRIEVLKGASGLLGGSGEPGGTVNLVTKKPLKQFAFNSTLSAGSWDNYRGVADLSMPLNPEASLRTRLIVVAQDRDFFYDKTHQENLLGHLVFEYDLNPRTTLSLAHTSQNKHIDASFYGLPAASTGELLNISRKTNPMPDWSNNHYKTNETVLGLEHRFANGWTATAKARYFEKEFDYIDSTPSSSGGGGVNTTTWTTTYSRIWDEKYDYRRKAIDVYLGGPFQWLNREHHFLIGYNYDYYYYDNAWGSSASLYYNVNLFNPEAAISQLTIPHSSANARKTVQNGIYTQARLKLLPPLTLIVGGRASNYQYSTRNIRPSTPSAWLKSTEESGEITPYAGIVYAIHPQVSLYASYTDIFIPQNYATASGENIDPRQGQQYEIGAKGGLFNHQLQITLAAFKLNDVNRAYRDLNYPNQSIYVAVGEVESKGWEIEVNGSPLPNWNLSAGFTHATNQYQKDANNQGLAISDEEPENSFKLWSTYQFVAGRWSGLKLGLGLNAVSEYYSSRSTSSTRGQAGYTLLGASASYALNRHLTLALNAENLTDKKYYASTGGLNVYNFYGAPRSYLLSLRYQH